jgi:hypothetical protein
MEQSTPLHAPLMSTHLHFAMTSTYRPFLFPLADPPAALLLGAGAPSKSSMSLALLSDVTGLLGGLLSGAPKLPGVGGPLAAALDMLATLCGMLTLRPMDGAGASPGPLVTPALGRGGALPRPSTPGPRWLSPRPPFGVGAGAGGVERGGGGGVAEGAGEVAAAPAALLTHLPKSGSKTKEFDSPRLALTGLFGAAAPVGPGAPAVPSSFLPPNQPPNQPERRFCATGRAAIFELAFIIRLGRISYHLLRRPF